MNSAKSDVELDLNIRKRKVNELGPKVVRNFAKFY